MITTIPASQLRLFADLEIGNNGENAKSAPVKILARTSDPVNVPGLGLIVHDFSSMKVDSRIPLDYCHETQETIGYLNKFDTSTGDLFCSGAIVPWQDDRGAEVLHKLQNGVPYQASIETGDDLTLDPIEAGESQMVNNRLINGPAYVVRDWTYVACAVAKFGRDSNTSTELMQFKKENRNINIHIKEKQMAVETEIKKVEATIENKVDNVVIAEVTGEVAKTVEPVTTLAKVEDVVEEVKTLTPTVVESDAKEDVRSKLKKYMATFGDVQGAKYFADAVPFKSALVAYVKTLTDKNVELEKRLASVDRGASGPVKFTADNNDKPKAKGLSGVFKRA